MDLAKEIFLFNSMKFSYFKEIKSYNDESLLCIKMDSKEYYYGRYILIVGDHKFFTRCRKESFTKFTIYFDPEFTISDNHKRLIEKEIKTNLINLTNTKLLGPVFLELSNFKQHYIGDNKVKQFMESDEVKAILNKVKKCRSCETINYDIDLCSNCIEKSITLILLSSKYRKGKYFGQLPIEITRIIISYL